MESVASFPMDFCVLMAAWTIAIGVCKQAVQSGVIVGCGVALRHE